MAHSSVIIVLDGRSIPCLIYLYQGDAGHFFASIQSAIEHRGLKILIFVEKYFFLIKKIKEMANQPYQHSCEAWK